MGKVVELPRSYAEELADEIEELEVLLALARACEASAAILKSPATKAALTHAIQAVIAALTVSGILDGR